jgi:hypothetical protein
MNFRAFQISTGSARPPLRKLGCLICFVGDGTILMPHQTATETLMLSAPWQLHPLFCSTEKITAKKSGTQLAINAD